MPVQQSAGGVTIRILVSPRSSRPRIGPVVGDRIKISVTAPPVEGKANAAIVALLSRELRVPRKDVEIVAGARGKRKTIRVAGVTREDLWNLVDS